MFQHVHKNRSPDLFVIIIKYTTSVAMKYPAFMFLLQLLII